MRTRGRTLSVVSAARWRIVRDVAVVVLLTVAAAAAVYAAGGTRTALPHAFYIPIVVAAARFGWPGGLLTAAIAAILCGPFMPLDVETETRQDLVNWVIRGGFFLAVGSVAALVTDRIRRALATEHAIAEERADLAAARSVLLQVVSHEIRTPLTVLKGGMEMLSRLEDLGPHGRSLVPAMRRSFARLEDLAEVVVAAVDDTTVDELRPRTVRVADAMQEAVNSLSPLLDPARVQISGSDPVITTEPEHLRLIVRCLVENALKFSPPDTPVLLSAEPDGNGRVIVEVRDSGPGIPDDFTTGELQIMRQGDDSTTREQGGLGLGLYATRRLVDRLGGELILKRAGTDGGTCAAVLLPSAGPTETPTLEPRSPTTRLDPHRDPTPHAVSDPQLGRHGSPGPG